MRIKIAIVQPLIRSAIVMLTCLATHASFAQSDEQFELGTDYNRLTPTQPTSSSPQQVEVAEIFWYGCPHCNTFDPILNAWDDDKAEYISFVRVPAVWNPLVRLHAQAFYTAEVLDKGEEMHDLFFAEIHNHGNYLDSPETLAAFFAGFGVSREEFASAFNSIEVNELLQRAEELNNRYQISSVPSIVINGKFTSNASMTGTYERLIELINFLAAEERGAE